MDVPHTTRGLWRPMGHSPGTLSFSFSFFCFFLLCFGFAFSKFEKNSSSGKIEI
jgi:hypothetical protein